MCLLRIPCRSGMCTTPLHVTSSQLIASEVFPAPVVKALLYPGAIVNGLVMNMTVPQWSNLLDIYNLTNVKEASAVTDLHRLEVLSLNLLVYFSIRLIDFDLLYGSSSDSGPYFCQRNYDLV